MFGKVRILIALAAFTLLGATPVVRPKTPKAALTAAQWASKCADFDEWDKPGPPFRIHGNTWYVGTCGITALLVTSPQGHALIDSGTDTGAQTVRANVSRAGYWIGDVKLLMMSHEHYDHVGGMARMQELSGAALAAPSAARLVMLSGQPAKDDPQFGLLPAMRPVKKVFEIDRTTTALAAQTAFKPILSPGHTPGAASWTWESCEGKRCLTIVYADSLSPISAEGYRFSDNPEYVEAFRAAIHAVGTTKCDILITPHPGSSDLRKRILSNGLVNRDACLDYAALMLERLEARLAKERGTK
jgi:metallo-beta-lactamase class B